MNLTKERRRSFINLIINIFLSLFALIFFNITIINYLTRGATEFNFRTFVFIILPAILCLVFIFSFFLKRSLKLALVLNFSALVFSLITVEFILSKKIHGGFENQKNISNLSPYEFLMSAEGSEHSIFTSGESLRRNFLIDFYKFGGQSHSKTVLCNEVGELVQYNSDRYGFNNQDMVWSDRDKKKIILLGDSYIHGHCQSPNNSVANSLQANFADEFDIVNLGMSGNGPLSNLGILIEYMGSLNNISHILYFHFEGNDLAPNLILESNRAELVNYLTGKKQYLINRQQEIDFAHRQYTKIARKNKSNQFDFQFLQHARLLQVRRLISRFIENRNVDYNLFEKVIIKLQEYTLLNKSKLLFIYIPASESFVRSSVHDNDYLEVLEILEKNEVPTVDLRKLFKSSDNPLENYFFLGSHLSDLGALNVASKISSILREGY